MVTNTMIEPLWRSTTGRCAGTFRAGCAGVGADGAAPSIGLEGADGAAPSKGGRRAGGVLSVKSGLEGGAPSPPFVPCFSIIKP